MHDTVVPDEPPELALELPPVELPPVELPPVELLALELPPLEEPPLLFELLLLLTAPELPPLLFELLELPPLEPPPLELLDSPVLCPALDEPALPDD